MSDLVQGEGLVGLTEIEAAARRLAGVSVSTPLLPADALSDATGAQVRLKCENLQRTGSFKIRGAHNFVSQLSDDQVSSGLITYSSGNHAQAVAVCAQVRRLRPDVAFGADLIAGFPTETEAMFARTLDLVADCGLTFLHVFPYSPRPGTPASRSSWWRTRPQG